MKHYKLINKLKGMLPLLVVVTLLVGFIVTFTPEVRADVAPRDIPAGCPGSSRAGPPAPGACEAIPAGCPGSNRAGPPAPRACESYYGEKWQDSPDGGSDDEEGGGIGASGGEHQCAPGQDVKTCVEDTPLMENINNIIYALSAGIGLVVTAMIIIGGIQYSAAGGDSNKVQAAKQKIYNAVLALLAFMFMFGFIEWLVPGGLFK
jgi:hypothetical protein